MIVARTDDRTLARLSPPRGGMPPTKRQVRTIDRLRVVRERALGMSATGPPPSPSPEHAGVEKPPERTAARNPWLWATAGVAVLAIAFGIWGLHERSNANDAKADLHAQEKPAASAPTTTQAQTQAQATKQETQPPPETQTESGDEGVKPGALAAVAAAFAAARKQLNESDAQVTELEDEVDKANAEADKAQQDAEKAKHEASSASEAAKPEAETKQAEAEKRQLGAKAQAAAACAKSMLEIVGGIPKAGSVDEGLNQAADQVTALAPKCKDSVASAGG